MITRQTLVSLPNNALSIHPASCIEAAALFSSMFAIFEATIEDGNPALSVHVGTTCDRFQGGLYILAACAATALEGLIDYDRYVETTSRGGLFSYDWLEAQHPDENGERDDLGAWLLDHIPHDALYDICENWRVPTREDLVLEIRQWCLERDIPTLAAKL